MLDPAESQQVSALFRELSDVDSHMVDAIEEVATLLTVEANATGDLVEQNDYANANRRVIAARLEMRPMREAIAGAMVRIRRLESDFIDISEAV